jgi:hypothetical protein
MSILELLMLPLGNMHAGEILHCPLGLMMGILLV